MEPNPPPPQENVSEPNLWNLTFPPQGKIVEPNLLNLSNLTRTYET